MINDTSIIWILNVLLFHAGVSTFVGVWTKLNKSVFQPRNIILLRDFIVDLSGS